MGHSTIVPGQKSPHGLVRKGGAGKPASCSTIGAYVMPWKAPRSGVAVETIDFTSENQQPIPFLIGVTVLKPELTEWVGLNETLRFQGYIFAPTRVETHDTFTVQLSVRQGQRTIATDLGIGKAPTAPGRNFPCGVLAVVFTGA